MESPEVDWTGVEPDRSPISPLDATQFVARLRLLGERVESIRVLRQGFTPQDSDESRIS